MSTLEQFRPTREGLIANLKIENPELIKSRRKLQKGDLLIWRYIHRPRISDEVPISVIDTTLDRTGTQIWSLYGYYLSSGENQKTVIRDYNITRREYMAASAIVERYKPIFEAWALLQSPPEIGFTGRPFVEKPNPIRKST